MPEMQYVDIGGFYRGSMAFKQEQPVIWVVLNPFWIDTYPVTNQRYARFIEAGGYKTPELWTEVGLSDDNYSGRSTTISLAGCT